MKQTLFDNMKHYYRQQCENRQEQLVGLYLRQERWENPAHAYPRGSWSQLFTDARETAK